MLWRATVVAFCLAVLTAPCGSRHARASAWNRPAGEGLGIFDFTFSGGSRYFNGLGKLVPVRSYEKRELSGYIEYGMTDWLTAVLKPTLVSTQLGSPDPARYTGLGSSEAGAQLHLLAFGPAVMAVQGTFRIPPTSSKRDPALIGNTSRDLEGRALVGMPFALGSLPSFVDLQLGYGLRSRPAPGEWHADLTLGTRPIPRLLMLLQSFTTVPQGPGSPWFPRSLYSKVGLTAVYELSRSWAVEIGIFTTIGGVDALREQGFKTGLWHTF